MMPVMHTLAWSVGWTELILILAIFLLLFGAKRLPEIARAIGKSMKEFKKASKDVKKELDYNDEDEDEDNPPYPPKDKTPKAPPEKTSEDEPSGNDGSKS